MSQVTGIAAADAVGRTPVEVLGSSAAGISLAPAGIVQIPKLRIANIERKDDILVGTLQDREREAYIGMAAHDLRAPLRNVLYLAEMAMADPNRNRELIAKMSSVARNGLALTTDLVRCAQSLGYGEQPLTEIPLRPFAQQILATLEGSPELDCRDVTMQLVGVVDSILLCTE